MLIGIDASRATRSRPTGTENYSLYLIRALLDLNGSHRYRLYFNEAPAEGFFPQGNRVEWRVIPFPRMWTHLRLAWEVTTHPPDVLFVPAHVLPRVHPRRCVATIHDLGYLHFPETHTPNARRYLDWATRFNARVARRIVVDSEATRADLMHYYGTESERIVVAYPAGTRGMAPVTDPAALEAVRQRYSTGPRYILFLGTLHPRKNPLMLVRAFTTLIRRKAIPDDVHLVLAGQKGWLWHDIVEATRAPETQGRVVLPGYVAGEDLAALLSGAEAFVMPSLYEGFGLPVLEAMACGTPVICSNTSSLPEVAGDAALLIDPYDIEGWADAVMRLLTDHTLRHDLSTRGLERARSFTWENTARRVLAALEAAAEEGDGDV
jgi:glycosyltransferase involved in cell wall biosynthesis